MSEVTYRELHYQSSELKHHYGPNVHILSDPFALTQLARLCAPGTVVPEVSNLVRSLYTHMLRSVVNREFPRKTVASETRMAAVIPEAAYRGQIIDPATRVTTVDIARAGILPSQICFDELSALMNPQAIRQDHLMMSRLTAEDHKVTGAGIGGIKMAGPVGESHFLLFPDPMGATGSSLSTAIQFYKDKVEGGHQFTPITLNLIVTPQYLRKMTEDHPDCVIYAFRLDRGMSTPDVLATTPGECWAQESGLTDNHYIVPGGGGFGEILNNALE